ncbi:4-oxalocrotonate tautomerase [Enterococcus gallinarum]|uniref:2-hydroxymuconate tautomerase n=1 Tax=Enterococcus gallinarum TaxID=1353 RepID=UPI00214BC905|nr:2-hydroxymuconate tautomerase [Enterococcus gallinarum]MCR1927686.1 4-oxalocrotonate tautomerase [Enterococcus gallinarum]
MPFIHVELVEGRSQEQLTNMMKEITEAVHKNTGAPKEHIHVIINEMKKGQYAVNGDWNNLLDFLSR